jgi:hypothetical protein
LQIEGLKLTLDKADALLKTIEAGKSELLNKMCSDFPRFYFVSAAELLEILFEEPNTVMKNGHHYWLVFS